MSLLFQAYPLARAALFSMDPEQAHEWTLRALQRTQGCDMARLLAARQPILPRTVMALPLRNPVGLAAGLWTWRRRRAIIGALEKQAGRPT